MQSFKSFKMKKNTYLLFLLVFLISYNAVSQCALVKLPLENRINESNLIIEGKVVKKRSFWDDQQHNIFTANEIEVYKSFKGEIKTTKIEILTRGGTVGLEAQEDHPSLQVNIGNVGIFLLTFNKENVSLNLKPGTSIYQPTAGPQGFIKYDKDAGGARDQFFSYENIEVDLYQRIEKVTREKRKILKEFDTPHIMMYTPSSRQMAFTFSPTTVTAGTDALLTISDMSGGLGSQGTVEFSNADDGGASIDVAVLDLEICSWTTTQIIVQVPDKACTGNFEVIPSAMGAITSSTSLTVTYAQINAESDAVTMGIFDSYETQHIDDNGTGGYTWQQHTDFASSSAADPFLRSLQTWCSNSGIYWDIGANSTIDVIANDGVNIARFDNGSELPSGVLGSCTSRFSGCFSGTKNCSAGTNDLKWYVSELDIVFDDGTNWYYGTGTPGFTEYDFESVSVHELGHGHQLGHVLPSGTSIMYYALNNGQENRTPSANEIACAADVYNRSTTTTVCSRSSMSTSDCNTLLPVELINFQAEKENQSVVLNWSTAAEINNDYFQIERSKDGRDFESLATISGAGFSNQKIDYLHLDKEPRNGLNYYRLKQVDYDGNYSYSDIVSANIEVKSEKVTISPNPIQGTELRASISLPKFMEANISIISLDGKILNQQFVQLESGINQIQLDVATYPPGVYWIRFNYNQSSIIEKFIKMN